MNTTTQPTTTETPTTKRALFYVDASGALCVAHVPCRDDGTVLPSFVSPDQWNAIRHSL